MQIVTADVIRELDRKTINELGIPGAVLMENAGRGAARVLLKHAHGLDRGPVVLVCGAGNNGGDGFVIARYLAHSGVDVCVYLLSESSRLAGDALDNFKLLAPLQIPVYEMPDADIFATLKTRMAHRHLWVDAILGTGLNSDVKGYFKSVIEFINSLNRPVFTVDIPSGLHTDTGQPCGIAIRADATATFAFPKIGHIQMPGATYTGDLHVIDIGIPPHIADGVIPGQHLITKPYIQKLLAPRSCDAHKGATGHVLVLAGSPGKSGAAAMSALSALRTGAGLVTLGLPESIHSILEPQVLEVMTLSLASNPSGALSADNTESVLDHLSDKKCLAMGPGMTVNEDTQKLVLGLVKESPVPVVIDADGLNNLAGSIHTLKEKKSDIILTPHPGEMARLTGKSIQAIQTDRIACAREFAELFQVYVVLKGARTIIAHPDGNVYVNMTGNPGMASAGMGDVLTGMIAGFLAQGYSSASAALIGTCLHGDAADQLVKTKGPYGYIASDVMDMIPESIGRAAGEQAFASPAALNQPYPEPV